MKTMAEVLAEHLPTASFGSFNMNGGGHSRYCSCGERFDVLYSELADDGSDTKPLLQRKAAAHVAADLAAAGFGPVREAQAEAWAAGYDKGTDLAAWAIGNRPQSERPDTSNPYRATS